MDIMSDIIQEIKEKIDLVDFLRSYLQLSPAGKNFKTSCPFHKEKTPSFIISPDRQIWHCFGCSKGGDAIRFLMFYENLEFFEALRILAEKAGIDFQKSAGGDQRRYNLLYEINKSAKDFFKKNFTPEALNYLKNRGLTKNTIENFEIGFASAGPDELTRNLLKMGFPAAEVETAGLTIKTERGTYWDRFRSRIMFPLFNAFGKVVGFTGRILPELENSGFGKYVNTPDTPIFNKSKILFGFHQTKNDIRESRVVILVEGQMDFLMMWQDGVKNVAATSGTALTVDHLRTLRRLADSLILLFDSDEAGQAATERAIDLAEANDFVVKIAKLEDKDPADFVRAKPGLIAQEIGKAMPVLEYYLERYPVVNARNSRANLPETKRNLRAVLGKIKNISSSVERGYWVKELEKRTGIQENFLMEELDSLKSVGVDQAFEDTSSDVNLSRQEIIADQLINLAFFKKEFFEQVSKFKDYLPEPHRQILSAESKTLNDVVLLRSSLSLTEQDEARASEQLAALLRQLQLEHWKNKRKETRFLLEEAQEANNDGRVLELLSEIAAINKAIQELG